MRKIWISFLMMLPCLFAQAGERCQEVSGAILTNFLLNETGTIDINGTTTPFYATTLGTVTGDLRGAVGVYVLSPLTDPVLHVQHHWVTEAGDTIFLAPADVTGSPIAGGLVLATANYTVMITGGTGRFAGATGTIVSFGGIDFSDPLHPRSILRYLGTVCFAQPKQ